MRLAAGCSRCGAVRLAFVLCVGKPRGAESEARSLTRFKWQVPSDGGGRGGGGGGPAGAAERGEAGRGGGC